MMKNFLVTVSVLSVTLIAVFFQTSYAQPVPRLGDYGSVVSGNWSSPSTWKIFSSTGHFDSTATSAPGGSANEYILTGTTVTYDAGSTYNQNCRDLIVQSGATFQSDQVLPQANGSLAVLKVEGDTIWVDGNLGSGKTDGLTIETKTSTSPYVITLCGSGGSVNLASVRPNSHQSNTVNFVFARNANINYAGTDSLGGAGIYSQRGNASQVTFTVNPGDTVTFAPHSGIYINPTVGNNGNINTIFNINGVVNDSGAVVLADTGAATATLNIGSTGKLIVRGTSIVQSLNGANVATITVNGTYEHAIDGGIIPTATWNTGSTCLITGSKTAGPTNANQNFYNLTVNCDSLMPVSYPCHFDMADNTIKGNLTIQNTNSVNPSSPTFFALTGYEVAGSPKSITINGNLIIDSVSSLAIDDYSKSHPVETVTTIVKGNLDVGGNLALTIGSAKNLINLEVMGNVNIQNGNLYSHSSTTDSLIFNGNKVQLFLGGTVNNNYNIMTLVRSGTTLYMDTSKFSGSSSTFTLEPNATIATGDSLGFNGNILVGGAKLLSNSANYIFNGYVAQATGTLMPDTLANLTINNSAGVALSQQTTILDTLFLMNGVFDNSIPFIEGPNFRLVTVNGSLKNPITEIKNLNMTPLSFKVEQNYPNPFNPSTTINYSMKTSGMVTIKIYNILGREIRTLVNEEKPEGNYNVVWDGRDNSGMTAPSGAYFYRYQAGNITQVKKMILLK